jgi:hypothetical protein
MCSLIWNSLEKIHNAITMAPITSYRAPVLCPENSVNFCIGTKAENTILFQFCDPEPFIRIIKGNINFEINNLFPIIISRHGNLK